MKFKIIGSESSKNLIKQALISYGVELNDEADVCLVEEGYPTSHPFVLMYKSEMLDQFMLSLIKHFHLEKTQAYTLSAKDEDGFIVVVPYHDIALVESFKDDVYVQTLSGRFRVRERLFELEAMLLSHGILRVNKSILVNLRVIDRIVPWLNSTLQLKLHPPLQSVMVTRSYLKAFKNALNI